MAQRDSLLAPQQPISTVSWAKRCQDDRSVQLCFSLLLVCRYQKHGGAFGYNTETSPGPAIPQPDSLVKFLPPQDRWPIDAVWDYHAGGGDFMNLDVFNDGMRATYGWPDSVEEYSRVAQTMTYDGERAMFEAYTRNKYTSTGVIQWMLNNAWPSTIWHLIRLLSANRRRILRYKKGL